MKAKVFRTLNVLLTLFLAFTLFVGCTGSGDGGNNGEDEYYSIFSRPVVQRPAEGKTPWNDVSTFVCYYGEYQEEMEEFEVAILEADNHTAETIAQLNDAGVWTITYITVGEDHYKSVGDGMGPGGFASYLLYDEDGEPIPNPNWGSWYVDAGNPVWQERLINEARGKLTKGCDGLFLDTLDTVDIAPATYDGMVSLVRRLREEFPDIKIVANRGFTILEDIAPFIDGCMYEVFSTGYDFEREMYIIREGNDWEWSVDIAVNVINKIRQSHYFPIFCLEYADLSTGLDAAIQRAYDIAWEYDFIPYVTTLMLNEIPIHDIVPQTQRGSKAISEEEVIVLEKNGDLTNKAYVGNGAVIAVDSTYFGYGFKALNDGYINKTELGWAQIGWASREDSNAHWVQITFPSTQTFNKVKIHWCLDGMTYYSSREIHIQIRQDGQWVDVAVEDDIEAMTQVSEITFDSVSGTTVRIYQPAGGGNANRENLMWISEVEVF